MVWASVAIILVNDNGKLVFVFLERKGEEWRLNNTKLESSIKSYDEVAIRDRLG